MWEIITGIAGLCAKVFDSIENRSYRCLGSAHDVLSKLNSTLLVINGGGNNRTGWFRVSQDQLDRDLADITVLLEELQQRVNGIKVKEDKGSYKLNKKGCADTLENLINQLGGAELAPLPQSLDKVGKERFALLIRFIYSPDLFWFIDKSKTFTAEEKEEQLKKLTKGTMKERDLEGFLRPIIFPEKPDR
ncbi:MAG: hypothetical protein ACHQAX_01250 [Gammaproteobacteria bacterium]